MIPVEVPVALTVCFILGAIWFRKVRKEAEGPGGDEK